MNSSRYGFDAETVLAFIYNENNRRRIIWSPSTTLAAMGIERYPHRPPDKYRAMKRLLAGLCAEGKITQRDALHSHYTMKEVAYERIGEDHSGVGW